MISYPIKCYILFENPGNQDQIRTKSFYKIFIVNDKKLLNTKFNICRTSGI